MKVFLGKCRDIAMSGVVALLPLYVCLIVINKAWKSFSSIGAALARMLEMESILGVAGTTVLSGILLLLICLLTGLLVRYSFLGAVTRAAEKQLSKYVPDYDNYKAKAEEKLQHKVKVLPFVSALIPSNEYWQPAYVVEQDQEGNCVVFLPEIPETNRGHVLLVRMDQIRILKQITANQLDASLRKRGSGLLSEYGLPIPKVHSTVVGERYPSGTMCES